MLFGFNKYLLEVIGADSMEKDPADLVLNPDTKSANAMMFFAGKSGTVPVQWNNSPFLAGGTVTSAFGANPKSKKRKNVLNYFEFIKTSKGFSK